MGDTPPTQPAATWRCPGGRLALRPQPWVGVDGEAESGRESPSVGIRPPPRLLCVLAGPAGRHPHPCLTPLHLLPSHPVPPTAAPLPSLLSPLGLPGSSDLASFPTSPLALYSPHPSPSVLPKKSATLLASLPFSPPYGSLHLADQACAFLPEAPPPFLPLPGVPSLPPHPWRLVPLLGLPDPGKPSEDVQVRGSLVAPGSPMRGRRHTPIQKGGGKGQ